MAVSIADMERVALGGGGGGVRFSQDVGQVIELGDLNDDLGLNMLMNPSKVIAQQDTSRTVNVSSYAPPPPPPDLLQFMDPLSG